MALRKMLGSAEHPTIIRLMRLIETQSKTTLTRFAGAYVKEHYLPILASLTPDEARPAAAIRAAEGYLADGKLPALKAAVKDARAAAQALADPIAQAAARAIATACAVVITPTNALGFTFYGAAAYAYSTAGTAAARSVHDQLATEELERILTALALMAVPDEPDPVRVDWGC